MLVTLASTSGAESNAPVAAAAITSFVRFNMADLLIIVIVIFALVLVLGLAQAIGDRAGRAVRGGGRKDVAGCSLRDHRVGVLLQQVALLDCLGGCRFHRAHIASLR